MQYQADDIQDPYRQKIEWPVLKQLLPRFRPHRWSLTACALLLAASSLLSLSGPLLVRHAIDVNFPDGDIPGLLQTGLLYFSIILLSFGVTYLQQVKLEIVGQRIIKEIRIDTFSHLTQLPQSFFDTHPVGQILSRIESDTEALRTMFTYTVVTILSDLLMMFGMLGVMFVLSPRLTLILLAVIPLVVFTVRYFNKRIVPIFVEVRRKTAEVYAYLEEYIRGAQIVQSFDQETNVIDRMNAVNRSKFNIEYPGEKLSNYFGHMVFLLSTLATVLILSFGGRWVLKRPDLLSIGTLVAFLGYIQRFFGPIFHLSEQINIIQKAFAGAKRIDDILNTPTQNQIVLKRLDPADSVTDKPEGRSEPVVEFQDVWFAYNPDDWVLKGISFRLEKGRRLAVVGPTGGGKSTIISLLYRFYVPQKGRISINGRDINRMNPEEFRSSISLVLQDIVLFPGTVIDNLRLDDPDISEEMVMRAINTVHAGDLIRRMDLGLKTQLTEHGTNLSVGERQLLSFARALVFNPEILVLDEATASIDPLTEHRVQGAMKTLLKERTALIVAHRLQTIVDCDEIMVIQDGRVMEHGTHSDLIAQKGLYFNLCQLQFTAGGIPS
ncbi:ABC transporter ATP-binding protein [bacterium]|nr:ABC transporter ATP-binding protein [candidate division CSSED10-310 bacterium]